MNWGAAALPLSIGLNVGLIVALLGCFLAIKGYRSMISDLFNGMDAYAMALRTGRATYQDAGVSEPRDPPITNA